MPVRWRLRTRRRERRSADENLPGPALLVFGRQWCTQTAAQSRTCGIHQVSDPAFPLLGPCVEARLTGVCGVLVAFVDPRQTQERDIVWPLSLKERRRLYGKCDLCPRFRCDHGSRNLASRWTTQHASAGKKRWHSCTTGVVPSKGLSLHRHRLNIVVRKVQLYCKQNGGRLGLWHAKHKRHSRVLYTAEQPPTRPIRRLNSTKPLSCSSNFARVTDGSTACIRARSRARKGTAC